MKIKESLSMHAAPLMLRIAVGVVFLWAGSVKLFTSTTFTGDDARVLVHLGLADPPALTDPEDTTEPREAEAASEDEAAAEEDPAADQTGDAGEEIAEAVDAVAGEVEETVEGVVEAVAEKVGEAAQAVEDSIAVGVPGGVEAKRLYSIAILLHRASHPEEGRGRLWPEALGSAGWVGSLSWLTAITETLGGALVLIGLLTRFWSMGLAVAMVVAMATTTIGPAAQSGNALLGFLPPLMLDAPGGVWVGAWMPWLFQLSMLMMSLALVCSGPGLFSLDRRVLGKGGEKSGKNKSKAPSPPTPPGGAKRTHPDRPL